MSLIELKEYILQSGLAAESSILFGICLIIICLIFFPKAAFGLSFWITLFVFIASFYFARFTPQEGVFSCFHFGTHTGYLKGFFSISAAIALFSFVEWRQGRNIQSRTEIFPILLFSLLGLDLLVQADGFWIMFLSAELFSICSYALAKPYTTDTHSVQSVVHYFGFGALASAIGIFGLSLILGFQDFTFSDMDILQNSIKVFPLVGSVFFIAFLFFKLGAFPFHFWVPKVYEQAPTPWVGYISVAPKVAGAFALFYLVQNLGVDVSTILSILIMVGMTFGNLAAMKSEKLKNLFSYSAIAQASVLMVPAAVGNIIPDVENQLLLFAIGYGIVNQGAFCAIQYFENQLGDQLKLPGLSGQFKLHPLPSVAFVVLLFSIIGLPPTIGFFAKVFLFSTLIPSSDPGTGSIQILLFSVLVFNTLLSLAYYVKIPYQLIFKTGSEELMPLRSSVATLFWVILASLFAVLAFIKPIFFFPIF